jgi:hypothetical protein
MQIRNMLVAGIALTAAAFATVAPAANASEESHGYNNGDSGFVNISVIAPVAAGQRSESDVLSMVGHCTFDQTVVPFSNDSVVQVVGKAVVTARDNSKVLGTAVRCQIKDFSTGAVYYDHWDGLPANAGVWADVYQAKTARLVVCTQVEALLSSGVLQSQTFPCQEPSALPS